MPARVPRTNEPAIIAATASPAATTPTIAVANQSAIPPVKTSPQNRGTTLIKSDDGHYYVDGMADGASMRFMVDTGASVIALTADDARKLGQTWYPNELQMVGRGVNGDVIGKPITLSRVRIGEIEATNVRAIIVPDGLDVSLLGQSFLTNVPNVIISGNQMTFG